MTGMAVTGDNDPAQRLQTIAPDGKPPRSVIETPAAAHAIKRQLIAADIGRARQRAVLKQNYDGHPPYDPAELKRRGLADMTNVNFKRLKALTDTNVDSYLDAQFEASEFATVITEFGNGTDGHNFSQVLTDEFNNTLKRWRGFYSVMNKSNFNRVFYGSGLLYHENDMNWRPQPAETGQVLVDKDADTNLENLDVICIRRNWRLHQLYRMIEDPVRATKLGWNVQAVRTAIIRAAENNQNMSYSVKLWETWNNRIKGNDIYMSFVSPGIDCYDLIAKEYDGTLSRRTLTEFDTDDVLFTGMKVAKHFSQLIHPFFLTEQESLWHSIRGYAAQLYNVLKILDKLDGRILDMTFIGASLVIQPSTEATRDKLNTLNLGPVTVLPAGVSLQSATFPNVSQGPMVTHNMLMQTYQQTSGEYQAQMQHTQAGEAPTATQNQNDLETLARLSSSLMNHFFNNCDVLLAEMFRRLSNPNLPDKCTPSGKSEWCQEARRFQKRVADRGVPPGAMHEPYLQSVTSVRALGQGSASSRKATSNELLSLLPLQQNPQARELMIKDAFTGIFGSKTAKRYFPAVPGRQLTNTAKTAELENAGMKAGNPFDVMPGEDAVTHLGIHMPMLIGATQSLTQSEGAQGKSADMGALQAVYQLLSVGLPHCSSHLQIIAGDPTQKQIVGVVVNALKKLDAIAIKLQFQLKTAATAAQRQAIQASQQQTAEAAKLQLEAAKLALAGQKQKHKESVDGIQLAIKITKATQDLNLNDISAAIGLHDAAIQNAMNIKQLNAPPETQPESAPAQ